MKFWLSSFILLAATGFGGYYYFYKSEATTDTVSPLGVVKKQDLFQRVNISGAVTPHRMMIFVPPFEGYVRKIYVGLGDKVKAGDPVVKIAPGGDDDAFPLRAPYDGVVVQVMKTEGQYVEKNKNDTIVRIDDLSRLYVVSDAPELDFAKLKVGQDVIIKASAIMDRTYKGKIIEIAQAASGQERWERSKVEFAIKAEITDHDSRLKPGMSVVLDVITEQSLGALTLRHEFIRKEGDAFFVTLENGTRRDVKVGLRNEEAFEIKEGLAEGEKVKPVDFLSL
jgi:multidrug efflux pump subunit AcrA (membrane-fusion protein)